MTKTQIYLESHQHRALLKEAHRKELSLAALLREIVNDYFSKKHTQVPLTPPEELYMSIVGLGHGGDRDVSEQHDRYLAEATDEHDHNHSR